jgi:uncharacterized protein (TIGR01777 family)
MSVILITGGSGLIGRRLTGLLLKEGHTVRWLTRKKSGVEGVEEFLWDPAAQTMDDDALEGADAIISLAGTPIAAKRWSEDFKKDIIQSRLDSSHTLLKSVTRHPGSVKTLVSASATGFYGDSDDRLLDEDHPAGKGFLAETTAQWESAYKNSNIRTVLLRIGIVLSDKGGALKELAAPLKTGICPVIGNGQQYMSWIHIDDLCRLFLHAIRQESLSGIYNAVAPEPVTHRQFMLTLRRVLRPLSLVVSVPAFFIRIILGEKSAIVLDSARVSASKTISSNFRFLFPSLEPALKDLYGKK